MNDIEKMKKVTEILHVEAEDVPKVLKRFKEDIANSKEH